MEFRAVGLKIASRMLRCGFPAQISESHDIEAPFSRGLVLIISIRLLARCGDRQRRVVGFRSVFRSPGCNGPEQGGLIIQRHSTVALTLLPDQPSFPRRRLFAFALDP